MGNNRYNNSVKLLREALEIIPLGSQTFSKSITQFPVGASPHFLTHGKGAFVYDVDGNKYLDFVNALACVSLGYCDDDVDAAVVEQLGNGVSFTLAHPLEVEVANLIKDVVPCAEMIRFAKNGTDATSAAIRLSRHITKKNIVLCSGYHGWQDWYIGSTTMNGGIPEAVSSLTKQFRYNDIQDLERLFNEYKDQVACVIMEPMNSTYPHGDFLKEVARVAKSNNAILIFDETVTGFRYSLGGAQEYFGVTPDIATFGKGVANGFPLSFIAGKRQFMEEINKIFFSGTFGGETLSLAAAKATILKLKKHSVPEYIKDLGEYLMSETKTAILDNGLEETLGITGHPSWSFITFGSTDKYSNWVIKTYFLQEIFKRGFIMIGTHNLSFSHRKEHVDQLIGCYRDVFKNLNHHIVNSSLEEALEVEPLKPLFKVR